MKKAKHNLIIEKRVLKLGEKFVLCKDSTVRSLATIAGVSKSTVHKDLTRRLQEIDNTLYNEVREKLNTNKDERHIRGGEATRQKYLCKKKGI